MTQHQPLIARASLCLLCVGPLLATVSSQGTSVRTLAINDVVTLKYVERSVSQVISVF